MDFGPDKRFWYGPASGRTTVDGKPCWPISNTCAAGMPMNTEAKTLGASLQADIDLTDTQLLRLGAEYQGYRSMTGGHPPGPTCIRAPFGTSTTAGATGWRCYGEWESAANAAMADLAGYSLRAGRYGYRGCPGLQHHPDRPHGNQYRRGQSLQCPGPSGNRQQRQPDRPGPLSPGRDQDLEFGFAHLVRSPNLYERYTWSTWTMAASMNNSVGDGNGYVGDINLKPEQANTLSATFDWHAPERDWEIQATPYYTYVTDYVDAIRTAVWMSRRLQCPAICQSEGAASTASISRARCLWLQERLWPVWPQGPPELYQRRRTGYE
jgi:iron complex outermembrane receptor protein